MIQCSPCMLLGCVLITAKVPLSGVGTYSEGTHIWKDRKSNILPQERKARQKRSCQSLSFTPAASLPYVHTPYRLRLPYTVLT